MSAMETDERRADLKSKVLEQLHDPVRLRICVLGAVLAFGYFAIYSPLNDIISDTSKKLIKDKKQLALAISLEKLQEEYARFDDRIPRNTDSKEWVQFMLNGIRKFPLKLVRLDCREPKKVGPYRAIILKVELEGTYLEMDKYIRWLETNKRLLRVDEISISPSRSGEHVTVLRMTVLGLTS